MVIGIDIGGTHVKSGLIAKATGKIHGELKSSPIRNDCNSTILTEILYRIIGELKSASEVSQVGIGSPGMVDTHQKRVIGGCYNIPYLQEIDWQASLADPLGVEIRIDNDANLAALAEWYYRSPRFENFAFITLGTGIGAGLILDGKLFHGGSYYAGEFGHISIDPQGRQCSCGLMGCIEAYASVSNILASIQNQGSDPVLHEAIETRRLQGLLEWLSSRSDTDTEMVRAIIVDAGERLGFACATMHNLLNFDAIAFGGGGIYLPTYFFEALESRFRVCSLPLSREHCKFVPAQFEYGAGLTGTAALYAVEA